MKRKEWRNQIKETMRGIKIPLTKSILIEINPFYQEVSICKSWDKLSETSDPELWTMLTTGHPGRIINTKFPSINIQIFFHPIWQWSLIITLCEGVDGAEQYSLNIYITYLLNNSMDTVSYLQNPETLAEENEKNAERMRKTRVGKAKQRKRSRTWFVSQIKRFIIYWFILLT